MSSPKTIDNNNSPACRSPGTPLSWRALESVARMQVLYLGKENNPLSDAMNPTTENDCNADITRHSYDRAHMRSLMEDMSASTFAHEQGSADRAGMTSAGSNSSCRSYSPFEESTTCHSQTSGVSFHSESASLRLAPRVSTPLSDMNGSHFHRQNGAMRRSPEPFSKPSTLPGDLSVSSIPESPSVTPSRRSQAPCLDASPVIVESSSSRSTIHLSNQRNGSETRPNRTPRLTQQTEDSPRGDSHGLRQPNQRTFTESPRRTRIPENEQITGLRGRARSRLKDRAAKQYRRPISKVSRDSHSSVSSCSEQESRASPRLPKIVDPYTQELVEKNSPDEKVHRAEPASNYVSRSQKQRRNPPEYSDKRTPTHEPSNSVAPEKEGASPAERSSDESDHGRKSHSPYPSSQSDSGIEERSGRRSQRRHDYESRSATSSHYSVPLDATVMLKNNVIELHSSHILAYSSPVLAEKMHREERGRNYTLDIPNGSIKEWRVVKPFLQPHSVQQAVVTTRNIPILLPWFHELKLDILLKECDLLLSTLTMPLENPTKHDWNDIVLLAHICSLAELPQTWKTSLDTLQTYLAHYPQVLCTEKTNLDIFMNLMRECSEARDFLWSTLNAYLPADMFLLNENLEEDDHDVAATLVTNSLFPYLLRERLHQHVSSQQQQVRKEKEMERLRKWHQRKKALEQAGQELEEMQKYNSILADDSGTWTEPSWMQPDDQTVGYANVIQEREEEEEEMDFPEVDNASKNPSSETETNLNAWADFAAWWQSWAQGKGVGCPEDCNKNQVAATEPVPKRTAWLETILRNLKRPSLFDASAGAAATTPHKRSTLKSTQKYSITPKKSNNGSKLKSSRKGDPRKFAC